MGTSIVYHRFLHCSGQQYLLKNVYWSKFVSIKSTQPCMLCITDLSRLLTPAIMPNLHHNLDAKVEQEVVSRQGMGILFDNILKPMGENPRWRISHSITCKLVLWKIYIQVMIKMLKWYYNGIMKMLSDIASILKVGQSVVLTYNHKLVSDSLIFLLSQLNSDGSYLLTIFFKQSWSGRQRLLSNSSSLSDL